MISSVVWTKGITSLILAIVAVLNALFFIYKAKKEKIILLTYLGISWIFAPLTEYLETIDFFSILLTGNNGAYNLFTISLLSYVWIPLAFIFDYLIAFELLFPNNKKYFQYFIITISIIYGIFLFSNIEESIYLGYPAISGEDLIVSGYVMFSIPAIIFYCYYAMLFIFNGLGFTYKSFKSVDSIRRKFMLLGIAYIWNSLMIFNPYILLFGMEIGQIVLFLNFLIQSWLIFYALKPKKSRKRKREKKPSQKEVKLVSYMLGKSKTIESTLDKSPVDVSLDKELLVFVSYATKDADMFKIKEIADTLTNFKEIKGILYWQEDMNDNIFEYMDENLSKCDVVILFCSKNALDSVPVKKEWTAAEAIGKPIIPVFYDIDHIPTLLKSRLGIEYNFYDIQKNIQGLYNLIIKKSLSLIK